ncbi:hypothetical protein J4732_09230 [Serratia marcescens]|uniref:Uncharacterized protein n=1 Tax=Serratia marcescens TaxID=615 RepID=A0A939NLX7_SERMA|nr:hypothetical protein [Serratia marcescens]
MKSAVLLGDPRRASHAIATVCPTAFSSCKNGASTPLALSSAPVSSSAK